jgi:hypothetical protein
MSKIVYHIKQKNMISHSENLKTLNIDNEVLNNTINKINEEKIAVKKVLELPAEITANINKKPWIRIPYPIREIKLMEYMKEKKMEDEEINKLLKLLYEKKLTNKVVNYNNQTGKIEDISEL